MAPLFTIESERLEQQRSLDAKKTQVERNRLGQFATPTPLADEIVRYGLDLLLSNSVRFIEPALGTGVFFSSLLRALSAGDLDKAVGYEIDPHYGDPARSIWENTPLEVRVEDFTLANLPATDDARFNLLLTNPPYVRHHHLSSSQKQHLRASSFDIIGERPSGYTGLYCYFIYLAHDWLSEGGIASWLIPSEFLDVNYGATLKRYLLDKVTLLRVHRFDAEDVQFDDALVSSCVIWYKKQQPVDDHEVELTFGGTHSHPRSRVMTPRKRLHQLRKWNEELISSNPMPPRLISTAGSEHPLFLDGPSLFSNFLPVGEPEEIAAAKPPLSISDVFQVKRGLATGNNGFFILTPERAAGLDLPQQFLRPILPSPRYLTDNIIESDETGAPLISERLLLLDCDLSPSAVRSNYPTLWAYLRSGMDSRVHEGYLCKNRRVWFHQENRPPAPFLCQYMSRKDLKTGKPIEFYLNLSRATASNNFMLLYPKDELALALRGDVNMSHRVLKLLQAITASVLTQNGRVYGGGLHKFEPRDLREIPVPGLRELIDFKRDGVMSAYVSFDAEEGAGSHTPQILAGSNQTERMSTEISRAVTDDAVREAFEKDASLIDTYEEGFTKQELKRLRIAEMIAKSGIESVKGRRSRPEAREEVSFVAETLVADGVRGLIDDDLDEISRVVAIQRDLRERLEKDDRLIARLKASTDGLAGEDLKRLKLVQRIVADGIREVQSRRELDTSKEAVVSDAKRFITLGARAVMSVGPQRGNDFLYRSIRGRWAENVIESIPATAYKFIPFGPSDSALPGHENHEEKVTNFHMITKIEGKRPDLLAFSKDVWDGLLPDEKSRIESLPNRTLDEKGLDLRILRKAYCGIEVKSSLWMYRKRLESGGGDLSVTLKEVEKIPFDTWMRKLELPIVFIQVFFDHAYIMSLKRMQEAIENEYMFEKGDISSNKDKETQKKTWQIPFSTDYEFGDVTFPEVNAEIVEMDDGSVVPFVSYVAEPLTSINWNVFRQEVGY